MLVTPVRTQTSCPRMTQVFPAPPQFGFVVQTVEGVRLQTPDIGHWASVVQTMSLERLQDPIASVTIAAPWQSPSQASPNLSWSVLSWVGL